MEDKEKNIAPKMLILEQLIEIEKLIKSMQRSITIHGCTLMILITMLIMSLN